MCAGVVYFLCAISFVTPNNPLKELLFGRKNALELIIFAMGKMLEKGANFFSTLSKTEIRGGYECNCHTTFLVRGK